MFKSKKIKLKYFFTKFLSSKLTISTFPKKMSAQNDFAQAVSMLSSLNTISNSIHGSDANLEYLQNELFARIRTMVSNNRNNAFRQRAIEREQEELSFQQHVRQRHPERPVNISVEYQSRDRPSIIPKKELETPFTWPCAVCLETPKWKDAVLTECYHCYCKSCWTGWMTAPGSNHCCPTCRHFEPITTSYRARASPKKPLPPDANDAK